MLRNTVITQSIKGQGGGAHSRIVYRNYERKGAVYICDGHLMVAIMHYRKHAQSSPPKVGAVSCGTEVMQLKSQKRKTCCGVYLFPRF